MAKRWPEKKTKRLAKYSMATNVVQDRKITERLPKHGTVLRCPEDCQNMAEQWLNDMIKI